MQPQTRFPRIRKWEYLPQVFGLAAASGSGNLAIGAGPVPESGLRGSGAGGEFGEMKGSPRVRVWHRLLWEVAESLHDIRRHPWFYAFSLLISAAILSLATRQINATTPRQANLVGLLERAVVALEEDNRLDSRWPR